jgi:hypothetical protein
MTHIVRPDTHTQFHIDLSWFEQNSRDLREDLHAALCDECRLRFPSPADAGLVDRIHPRTAEVHRVDALWESVADHCGHKPGFIAPSTPLTVAIFRALLANSNEPMNSEQLHKRVGKNNPAGILKVLLSNEGENGLVRVETNQVES